MNIDLITIGKTDSEHVDALVSDYQKRINRSVKFNIVTLPDVRSARKLSEQDQKRLEGRNLLKIIAPGDHVVLLDDRGDMHRSVGFAEWMQKRMNLGGKKLIFVIGGPYGFSDEVYARANEKMSLSPMTFSHQIVRAIFCEQLYRAFSIISGSPYHHE